MGVRNHPDDLPPEFFEAPPPDSKESFCLVRARHVIERKEINWIAESMSIVDEHNAYILMRDRCGKCFKDYLILWTVPV